MLSFFDKIEDCELQGRNFIKSLIHHRFFLKIFFSKQIVSSTCPKNNLWWVLFIAKLQHEYCKNSIIEFFWEIFKLLQSVIFRNIFIYEEANCMKDYMKARQRKARKGTTLRPFYAECFLTSNICYKITIETEQYTKYTRY